MARIRLGDFGNAVAPVASPARVPVQAFVRGDAGTFEQLQRTATGLVEGERAARDAQIEREADLAAQARREQELESRRRLAELRSAQRMQAYTGFNIDIDDFAESLTSQLATGKVKREQLPDLFQKGLDDLKKKRLEGLDPESQELVIGHFQVAERGARRALGRAIETNWKQEQSARITETGENLQRLAVKDPAGAIRQWNTLLDAHGPGVYGADKVAGQKQAFAERAYAQHYLSRLTAVRRDYRGLSALAGEISKNSVLDPGKQNDILARIEGYQQTIETRAEAARERRLRTVEREINALNTMTLQGFDPAPDQIIAAQAAAKGTELEPLAQQMAVTARETARFRAMPPRAQEAALNDLEANVRKAPSPGGIELVGKLRTIARNQQELVRDDPISFAAQKGIAEVQPIDISKPETFKDQLAARLTIARGMQAQYGAPLRVFTKQEAELLPKMFEGLNPQQKAEQLRVLGQAISDPAAMRALAGQLHVKDPGLATSMFLAAKDRRDNKGRNLAELYLVGQDAITSKSAKIDEARETGLRAEITQQLTGVYATTTARDAAVDVAMKLWASGRVTNNGLDSVSRAVEAATGGLTEWNGTKVAKPYGWTDSRFRDAIRSITPEQLNALGGGRPVIRNPDGSVSTERTITIEVDGRHVLLPTIVDGKQRSESEAVQLWRGGKNKEVGTFASAAEAERAAIARSKQGGGQAQFRVGKDTISAEQLAKTLPSSRLQTVGDGVYSIIAGPDYVRLPDGRPLRLELR